MLVRVRPETPSRTLLLAVASAAALVVLGTSWVATRVQLAPLLGFTLAYGFVAGQILALAWAAPVRGLRELAPAVGSALLLIGLLRALDAASEPWSAALLTFALGVAASSIGAALGGRIEQPGQLAAVALVSATADLWSVFDPSAPSARFAAEALAEPEKLALFALPFPLLGSDLIAPVIGAGDIAFTALYVAAARAHRLAVGRLLVALAVAYAAGLIGLLALLRPLPLLPLLGLAVVASDARARSLSAREWRTVAAVCVGMLLLVVLLRTR
jgi:hypothetical protein